MTRRPYPLEAALKLRKMQLDEAQAALSEALEQVRHAEGALQYATDRLQAHQDRTRLDKEQRSAQTEATTGNALRQGDHYLARRATEESQLQRVCDERRSALHDAQSVVDQARAILATARAEHRAVEQHRERWADARRKNMENKAEDEAEDVLAARRK